MTMLCVLTLVLRIVLFITLTPDASSFLLDEPGCLVYPPCSCSPFRIHCESTNLTTFPKMKEGNVPGPLLTFFLQDNQLTTIPPYSFSNLTLSSYTEIGLVLFNNSLKNIATDAFSGVTAAVTSIDVEENKLTTVPAEFLTLSNLKALYLGHNPIVSLNPAAMQHLGRNLVEFSLDLTHLNTWPSQMNSLTSLERLYVRYVNMSHLDRGVFDGFSSTLQTLSMEYSQLVEVPADVCHLPRLDTLEINHNTPTNTTWFDACHRNVTSVTTVTLKYDHLAYMPDVFNMFPSMTSLNVAYNQLSAIRWDSVPSNAPLFELYMEYNDFTRIPPVLIKLNNLIFLNMQSNKVTYIGDCDFGYLMHLQILKLHNNPIEYISPDAFKTNLSLKELDLRNTKLRQLPSSITRSHQLSYLDLSGSPVNCTCDMSFLLALSARTRVSGNCTNRPLQLQTFITKDVPNCP